MRIFTIIFSFYLAFLAFHPGLEQLSLFEVADAGSCCAGSCSAGETDSTDEEQAPTSCNPFQSCECCVCVKPDISVPSLSPFIVHARLTAMKNEKVPSQDPDEFWQPPQTI